MLVKTQKPDLIWFEATTAGRMRVFSALAEQCKDRLPGTWTFQKMDHYVFLRRAWEEELALAG